MKVSLDPNTSSPVPRVRKRRALGMISMKALEMSKTARAQTTWTWTEEPDEEELKEMMGDVMYLCCQRPEKRRAMLENADKGLIKQICECCQLILKGDVPVTYDEKDNLEKHKKVMRALRDKKKSHEEKKDIIVQNGGGFLLSLIPTLIGAVSAMLAK